MRPPDYSLWFWEQAVAGGTTSLKDLVSKVGAKDLRVEVRDWDRFGQHTVLGECVLKGEQLVQLIKRSDKLQKDADKVSNTLFLFSRQAAKRKIRPRFIYIYNRPR